ncbi:MAG: hypothetical protein ACE5KZ_13685 [Candidatus Scalinduaceae bacterium]
MYNPLKQLFSLASFLIFLIILTALSQSVSAEESDDSLYKLLYGDLAHLKNFNRVTVTIQTENASQNAKKMGLIEGTEKQLFASNEYILSQNLTSFAKLRLGTNLPDLRIMTESEKKEYDSRRSDRSEQEKLESAHFMIKIWLVGNDYPIACHIKCIVRNGKEDIWQTEFLGYGSDDKMLGVSKHRITSIVEKFAVAYYKSKRL